MLVGPLPGDSDKGLKAYRETIKRQKIQIRGKALATQRKKIKAGSMSDLKQKIILEGLVSWPSIGAWMIGSTLLMGGWAVGSVLVGFLGATIFGVGVAWSLTSLTMRYDSIKAKVTGEIKESIRAERNGKLDELDVKLTLDKDPRDQNALRDLRRIYAEFDEFCEGGKIPQHMRETMLVRINELFDSCVKNLEICYDLWNTARTLRGKVRQKLMDNREAILQDVVKSVENFTNVVSSIMTLSHHNGELTGVNTKLDEELAACLLMEQRLRDLGNPDVNPTYEEYLH
jgi:hypothetical protein